MRDLAKEFIDALLSRFQSLAVVTENFPEEMRTPEFNEGGMTSWKPIKGTLQVADYRRLEEKHGVLFPQSFIDWHKEYYFLDADAVILRLPISSPTEPLHHLEKKLDWSLSKDLIAQKIYPFGDSSNDIGPLVFNGIDPKPGNEFPIHYYDHDYGGHLYGLQEEIFSSFTKLLECVIHYLKESKTKDSSEVIPEFFRIDPEGAGKNGLIYWLGHTDINHEDYPKYINR